MPTKQDLELAKRLMSARVLDEDQLRAAFDMQARLHAGGQDVGIEPVLYHLGLLPRGALRVVRAPPPLEAQPFTNYRLEAPLGEGGSSTVYRALYTPNRTPVAVKVLDPIQALRPSFLDGFQREARTLIELEHENIVLGYEVGCEGGRYFFSMELVDGITVLDVIDRRGFLENAEALSITLQSARALAHLHERGFLHRDIKPGNIMVESSGRARLIDLGLIRALPEGGRSTDDEETTTVGTVEYVSPEQARGRADLDPRSDIYSLGVTLYHMVVGEVPFQGENDYETMAKQVLSAMDTQKVKQRRIAPEVHFFITKMTSKEREMRFETVEDVIRAIEGYVPGEPVPVILGEPPVARPVAPPVAKPVAPPPVAKPVPPAPVAQPAAPPESDETPKAQTPPAPVPTRRRKHIRKGGDDGGTDRPKRR